MKVGFLPRESNRRKEKKVFSSIDVMIVVASNGFLFYVKNIEVFSSIDSRIL
jgi:hypothetical protein